MPASKVPVGNLPKVWPRGTNAIRNSCPHGFPPISRPHGVTQHGRMVVQMQPAMGLTHDMRRRKPSPAQLPVRASAALELASAAHRCVSAGLGHSCSLFLGSEASVVVDKVKPMDVMPCAERANVCPPCMRAIAATIAKPNP